MQVDMKVKVPDGYELTGEYRYVNTGEYYLYIDKNGLISAKLYNIPNSCILTPHLILRKVCAWREATIDDLKKVKAGEMVECRIWNGFLWKEKYTLIGCYIYPCADIYWQVKGKDGFYSNWKTCAVKES